MAVPPTRFSDADPLRLEGSRVAVTGAGGFIGRATCAALVRRGAAVTGIDVVEESGLEVEATGASFRRADVADAASIRAALAGGVDGLVHAAAIVSDWTTMDEAVRVNVGGTASALDAAAEAGARRAVHVSSVVVYGYEHPGSQDESAPRRVAGIPYLDTKSASDRMAARRGAIVIRPGDVYGPGSVPWTIRALELVRAPLAAVPGGDALMLPVYVDDLVAALLAALERGTPGSAYAVWHGTPVSFRDYYDAYAQMAGARPVRSVPRAAMAAVGGGLEIAARATGRPPLFTRDALTFVSRRGTVSNERARLELGWEPQVDLEEGLRRTEAWLQAEGLL